jgi:glycyl-tRNA synthetase
MVRKMFVIPSFEIHGGVKGLFDLGPPGCGLKANVIDTWRKHFVLEESMLEVCRQSEKRHLLLELNFQSCVAA